MPDIRRFISPAVAWRQGSLGLPDLGISTLDDVLTDIRRITDVCSLPLLVDAGYRFWFFLAFNVARTVKSMIKAGAAGLHIEDQVGAKRCGHRPNKAIVSKENGGSGSARRWMRKPILILWSWRAPMRWR